MKRIWNAFCMCYSMFTALPCPYRPWDEDARDWMLVMLPMVGLVVGLLWVILGLLGWGLFPAVGGALVAALPWLLTGFIHLDGYMDTCDAMLSWRPLEKRLKILKDSHTGAFAVVGLGLLFLFSHDAARGLIDLRALVFVPVVSRCGSALSVLSLKPIGHSQYAGTKGKTPQRLAIMLMWLMTIIVCALWMGGPAIALLIETVVYALAMAWVYRTLKGVSGDVAGFALTVSECAALIALTRFGG